VIATFELAHVFLPKLRKRKRAASTISLKPLFLCKPAC
jgi:hypothetical protein